MPARDGRVDLVSLMMLLGKQQINHVWVEAGAQLAGALLTAGVVDELIVYLAPKLLGDGARGLCALPGPRVYRMRQPFALARQCRWVPICA